MTGELLQSEPKDVSSNDTDCPFCKADLMPLEQHPWYPLGHLKYENFDCPHCGEGLIVSCNVWYYVVSEHSQFLTEHEYRTDQEWDAIMEGLGQ